MYYETECSCGFPNVEVFSEIIDEVQFVFVVNFIYLFSKLFNKNIYRGLIK